MTVRSPARAGAACAALAAAAFVSGPPLRADERVEAPPPVRSDPFPDPLPNPLPGAPAPSPSLAARLAAAYASKGNGYEARTRHKRKDGAPLYTNRLILETSPYLLQHAHNPVNWYPSGDEAFEAARKLGRPVLLSIGYSTCYWCHVMERESFEDLEIARYLNEHYVAIKVDREERPDVDSVYMAAVQRMVGRGGWPMTTWLTPDREPFYGGTYFPPRDGVRGSRVGFLTLLRRMKSLHDAHPKKLAEQARAIVTAVEADAVPTPGTAPPDAEVLHRSFKAFERSFDEEHAGFGSGTKFPRSVVLRFLTRYFRRTREDAAAVMVARTLDAMASGGLRDHVAGGFHRYTTDRRWRVPHFEKMLYDNALLAVAYLEWYRVTGEARWAEIVRETLDYLDRDMSAPGGGFHAATDAETDGREGATFVWTREEFRRVLGDADGALLADYYGVTPSGNFEGGASVLRIPTPLEEFAASKRTAPAAFAVRLARAREGLRDERARRPQPHTDTKVLAAWNGLAVGAFAQAGHVLDEPRYTRRAARAASFVLSKLRGPDGLRRSWSEGEARHAGTLEDYAFVIAGLLDLFQADLDPRWLAEARALQAEQDARFLETLDAERGAYFMSSLGASDLIVREKPWEDYAVPSGNSVAALNLLRLAEWTGDDAYRRRAREVLAALGPVLRRGVAAAPLLASALDFELDKPKEIVLVEPAGSKPSERDRRRVRDMLARYRSTFLPNAVFAQVVEGPALERLRAAVPWLAGKRALEGRATAFVCERYVCELPTSDPARFAAQIAKVEPL